MFSAAQVHTLAGLKQIQHCRMDFKSDIEALHLLKFQIKVLTTALLLNTYDQIYRTTGMEYIDRAWLITRNSRCHR